MLSVSSFLRIIQYLLSEKLGNLAFVYVKFVESERYTCVDNVNIDYCEFLALN